MTRNHHGNSSRSSDTTCLPGQFFIMTILALVLVVFLLLLKLSLTTTTTTTLTSVVFAEASAIVDHVGGTTTSSSSSCTLSQALQALSLNNNNNNKDDDVAVGSSNNIFDEVGFHIHRNGQPESCGSIMPTITMETTNSGDHSNGSSNQEKLMNIMMSTLLTQDDEDNCNINSNNKENDKLGEEEEEDDTTMNDGPLNEYQMGSLLTQFIMKSFTQHDITTCASDDEPSLETAGFARYCDMGPERTVIQYDHDQLIPIPAGSSSSSTDSTASTTATLPCRFFTREGLRITSLSVLKDAMMKAKEQFPIKQQQCASTDASSSSSSSDDYDDYNNTCSPTPMLDLYAVPAGRVFMFGPSYIGERFILDHVRDTMNQSLVLEVLSLQPRVFDIYNFFSIDESNSLIHKAMNEKSETHGFHRSTTGTVGASVFDKRTSENAWDTHGKTALAIKSRCFHLLGMGEYRDAYSDGLQILRYNLTTAYVPHMDYLSDTSSEDYNYDSSTTGGNRFATILLYMSNMTDNDGGETVFSAGWPPETSIDERIPLHRAISDLRQSGDVSDLLTEGSWQENMVAKCRSRLRVQPYATRAVLFYSQYPNGKKDIHAEHGGCPVLNGTKLAANLWTWSGIRPEFHGAPLKPGRTPKPKTQPNQKKARFTNRSKNPIYDNADLYYDENGFFGKLGSHDPDVNVNTYEGHVWNIKVNGQTLKTFIIGTDETQVFEI